MLGKKRLSIHQPFYFCHVVYVIRLKKSIIGQLKHFEVYLKKQPESMLILI
jgi:hypothetical protein